MFSFSSSTLTKIKDIGFMANGGLFAVITAVTPLFLSYCFEIADQNGQTSLSIHDKEKWETFYKATMYAYPAIILVSIASYIFLLRKGIVPEAIIHMSLGKLDATTAPVAAATILTILYMQGKNFYDALRETLQRVYPSSFMFTVPRTERLKRLPDSLKLTDPHLSSEDDTKLRKDRLIYLIITSGLKREGLEDLSLAQLIKLFEETMSAKINSPLITTKIRNIMAGNKPTSTPPATAATQTDPKPSAPKP